MKTVDKLVRKQFKPLSLIRIDWKCAFLYNLWNYIPSRWSLKSLWKMVAIFCMNPVSNPVALLFKTLYETCAIVFTLLAPRCFLLHYNKIFCFYSQNGDGYVDSDKKMKKIIKAIEDAVKSQGWVSTGSTGDVHIAEVYCLNLNALKISLLSY